MRLRGATVCGLMVALAIASCQRKTVFSQYEGTPLTGWERNDTVDFFIPPIDAEGEMHEQVGLRINSKYPFKGLCLVIHQTIVPTAGGNAGAIHRTDTLNCRLSDDSGNIEGSGISSYQYDFPLATLHIRRGDSLHIRMHHNMRREILPGISDVGITLKQR